MKFRYLLRIFFSLAIIIAALSCKKDKKEKTLPSLTGKVEFEIPEFVEPGQTITTRPSGVTHPKGKKVGYYFYVPLLPKDEQRDTVKTTESELMKNFTMTFRTDTVGTYTIFCYAYAEGYQSSSTAKYATVVNPDINSEYASIKYEGSKESIGQMLTTKVPIGSANQYYTAKYYTTTINGKEWLVNNVHFPYLGKPFRNAEPMAKIFGSYYNYEDATKVCPQGWSLPTESDCNNLLSFVEAQIEAGTYKAQTVVGALVADATFNTNQMWEYWSLAQGGFGKITNETGLSILPAGYCNLSDDKWEGSYQYATFWLKSDDDSSKEANVLYIDNYSKDIKFAPMDKASFGANVRCVKD